MANITLENPEYFKVIYEGKNFNTAFKKLEKLYNGFIDELEGGKFQVIELSDNIDSSDLKSYEHYITIKGREIYSNSEIDKKHKIVKMWHINEVIKDINMRTNENYVFVDTGVYGNWKGIAIKGKEDNLRFAQKSIYDLHDILVNLLGVLNDMFYKEYLNNKGQ